MSTKQAIALKEKGNAFFKQKEYGKAIEQYTFAIECDPQNHALYTNRAACYATMGEWEKVLRDADRAIARKNDWVKVRRAFLTRHLPRFSAFCFFFSKKKKQKKEKFGRAAGD